MYSMFQRPTANQTMHSELPVAPSKVFESRVTAYFSDSSGLVGARIVRHAYLDS